jgi:hypothetical protein
MADERIDVQLNPTTSYTYSDGSVKEGTACSACGSSYRACTMKLLRASERVPCCGSCAYTDTHAERVVGQEVTLVGPSKIVQVDSRGRVGLAPFVREGAYLVTKRPDGALLLEPAVVMTEAELARIKKKEA